MMNANAKLLPLLVLSVVTGAGLAWMHLRLEDVERRITHTESANLWQHKSLGVIQHWLELLSARTSTTLPCPGQSPCVCFDADGAMWVSEAP